MRCERTVWSKSTVPNSDGSQSGQPPLVAGRLCPTVAGAGAAAGGLAAGAGAPAGGLAAGGLAAPPAAGRDAPVCGGSLPAGGA
jgi:hypothetical protein